MSSRFVGPVTSVLRSAVRQLRISPEKRAKYLETVTADRISEPFRVPGVHLPMHTFTLFGDDPPSTTEDVARLRLRFRHRSLSELEAAGVIEWDRDAHLVRKGRNFYDRWDKMCQEKL